MSDDAPAARDAAVTGVDVLADGEMEVDGRMPWSSNATFLVTLSIGEECTKGIYKPHRGERPLWDFPDGLYQREVAAYELAAWLGWDCIPRTVERDGHFGVGSVQQFVNARFEEHYFTILERSDDVEITQLRRMGVFDVLANNADRKGGHCLIDGDAHIWGIDQGLCFHEEFKLRTVIWDFAGQRVESDLFDDVRRLADVGSADQLGRIGELLSANECEALVGRAQRMIRKPVFPHPGNRHAYPWPMV